MSIESVQGLQTYRPELVLGMEASAPPPDEKHSQETPPAPVAKSNVDGVIQFAQDQVSGKMRMQVVNPESGEVVRQIPPEDLVAISRMLGILFDRVA